jgi:hypothetical protein
MMHAGSIYENQIETFSGVQNQRIDSRFMHFLERPNHRLLSTVTSVELLSILRPILVRFHPQMEM